MADHPHRRRNARKQNLFQKDCTHSPSQTLTIVKLLMYAFGDDPNPNPESVAVLEEIVTEYINEMVPPPNIPFPSPQTLFDCSFREIAQKVCEGLGLSCGTDE